MPKRRSKRENSRRTDYINIQDADSSYWTKDSISEKTFFSKMSGYDGHHKLLMKSNVEGGSLACRGRGKEYYRNGMHELWEVVCNSSTDHLNRRFKPGTSFDVNKLHTPGISLEWPYSISPSHKGIRITETLGEMMRMNMVSIRNLLLLIKYIECGTIQEVVEEVLTADGVKEHEMYVFKWSLRELINELKPIPLGKFFHKDDVIMKKVLSKIIGMEGTYGMVVEKYNNERNSSCHMGIPKPGYIPDEGDWPLHVVKFLLNYHSQFLDAAAGELGIKSGITAEMELSWTNQYYGRTLSNIAMKLRFPEAFNVFKINGLDYDRLGDKTYDVLGAMRTYNTNSTDLGNRRMGYKEFGTYIREMIEDLRETDQNPPQIPRPHSSHLIDVGCGGKQPLIGGEAPANAVVVGMSIISVIMTFLLLGICFFEVKKTNKRSNERECERY